MLSKTRTTIITVVAAFSFAGAAIGPAVAQATTKQAPKQTHEQLCQGYEEEFNVHEETAENPTYSPTTKANAHRAAATVARNAIRAGCDTSAWRELPPETSLTILAPPGTAIQGAPEGTPVRVTATLAMQ
jgi:hypothetical protein